MGYSKEEIKSNIVNDIRWTIRTLEVLFQRQTNNEQRIGQTTEHNNRGFNGTDGVILSSFYKQVQKRKQNGNPVLLTEKQIEICKKKLPKYWKQVLEEIKLKSGE